MPILGSIGGASEGAYRGNLDDYPDLFSFESVIDAEPGDIYTSGISTITGLNYKAKVTIGVGASVSVNGGAFSTLPQYVQNNDEIRLRLQTIKNNVPSDFSRNNLGVVRVGRSTAIWSVLTRAQDILPNPISFNSISNAPVGIAITSNEVTISGLEPNYPTTIISGIGSFSINGGAPSTSGIVFNGDVIYLVRPILPEVPESYTEDTIVQVEVGTFITNWIVSPLAADLVPDQFTFVNLVKNDTDPTAPGISSSYISNTITVTGINSITTPKFKVPISIATTSLNTDISYDINESGNFTSNPGQVSGGDKVRVKVTTPPTYLTDANATLNIAGITSTWKLKTRFRPFNTIPNPFTFNDVLNSVSLATTYTSNTITLSGITTGREGTAFIVSGPGQFKVDRLGSTIRNYGTASFGVQNGDQITLQMSSGPNYGDTRNVEFSVNGVDFTDTVGFRSDTWTVTNVPTPNAPNIEFSIGPSASAGILSADIEFGDNPTISWNVTGSIPGAVTSVTIDNNIGSVPFSGSRTVTPTKNGVTTYRLTAVGPGGTTTASISFTIPPAPAILSFAAFPNPIISGESSELTWDIINDVDEVTINNGGGISTEANGSVFVNPPLDTIYTLSAKGAGGTRTQTLLLDVISTPIVTINADDPDLDTGGSTTLRWTTTDAFSAEIDQGVGGVSTVGSRIVNPSSTTTYTLSATGPAGTGTGSTTVSVFPIPTINSFSASPTQVAPNASTTLSWNTSNAVSVEIIPNVGSVSATGSQSVTLGSSDTTYTITATGGGGAIRTSSVTVTILPAPTASFYASPTSIFLGSSSNLYWSTTNASSVQLTDFGSVETSGSRSVSPTATRTYYLTASNATGSVQPSATVSVTCTESTTVYRYGGGSCGFCPPNTCWGTYYLGSDGQYYPNPGSTGGRVGNVNSAWVSNLGRPCPSGQIDGQVSLYAAFGDNYSTYSNYIRGAFSYQFVSSRCGSSFYSLSANVYCRY